MRNRKYHALFISICMLMYVEPLHAQSQTTVLNEKNEIYAEEQGSILGLWINGIDQRQDIFLTVLNQKKYIECEILKNNFMDLDKFSKTELNGISICSLSEQDIEVVEDLDLQLLKINIPTQYMQSQQMNSSIAAQLSLPNLGGFLNYQTFYQENEQSKQATATAELGIFWKNIFFSSNHIFRKKYEASATDFQQHMRLNTNLTFEFPENLTTLQLGDNVSLSTGISQPYYFGGIRWGTNFTMRPDFVYWNTPSFQGSALVPSTIDLIINGNKAFQSKVNPGEFNLDSNINFRGLGQAEMIVEDILGNKTVQNVPIFVTERLLKKGLNDYSLSAGKLRYDFSQKPDDYREWFGSAYFRRGITEKTTLGASIDASEDIQNYGVLLSQNLFGLGLFELNSAYSDSIYGQGYTVSTEFKRDKNNYSIGLKSQYYSPDFKILGMDYTLPDNKFTLPEQEQLIFLSRSGIPVLGNLSFSYIEQKYRKSAEQENKKLFNLRTSRMLLRDLNMSLGVSYDAGVEKDHRIDLSLSYRFNDKHSAYFNQTDTDSSYLTLNKNTSDATGIDYVIGAGRIEEENSANMNTRLKSKVGDLDLQYLQTEDTNRYSVAFQGAIAWLGQSVGLSKSVNNAFALVNVTDTPKIDVYRNDLYIGKTNKNGEIFIHDLIGYTQQHLSFDENQLNIEDKVTLARKTIMPLNKRGYIIDFPVLHTREVTFKIVDEQGQFLPQSSEIMVNHHSDDLYPIGTDHLVTIFGLTEQKHVFTVRKSISDTCQVDVDLQHAVYSTDPMVVICKEVK